MRHRLAALLAAFACGIGPLASQERDSPALTAPPATLIADNIRFDGSSSVSATGAVEIFYNGARLRAQSIRYDGATGALSVDGPLVLTDADGSTALFAEFAEIDPDLQNGVLQSARLVLERQLQIAATQIDRSDGRYTQMYQAVASSCEVCADRPTPIWEIRAERIIHDAEEQQLYFDNAQLRVMGVPVFWLPRMRLPDPTVERVSGFLAPSLRSDSVYGNQVLVPYFQTLGDHADVTLTPWVGLGPQTVELRYRHAFRNGRIQLDGAVTRDDHPSDAPRAYLFGSGRFDLPRGFTLNLQGEFASDRDYLDDYGFGNPDYLESYARISRTTREAHIEGGLTYFESLRPGADNGNLPNRVAGAAISLRHSPALIGGTLSTDIEGVGYFRADSQPGTLTEPNGRDVARVAGLIDWRRTEEFGGLQARFEGALQGALYNTDQGGPFDGTRTQLAPYGAVTLRYPLQAVSGNGTAHVFEPVAQVVWSDIYGGAVPNEDSVLVEFDEANLFSLDRFPGWDRQETGARTNLGLSYSQVSADPQGLSFTVAGGLVLRGQPLDGLTTGSGLDGTRSDILMAAHLRFGDRLGVVNRALFDTDLSFTTSEMALYWRGPSHELASSYTYLAADPGEQRPEDLSEWSLDATYDFDRGWQAGVNWRYDFMEQSPSETGLSLGYSNECLDMAFALDRRYSTENGTSPATSMSFTISLAGFGASREGRSTARSCRG